jgi:hypothetical protein
MPVQWPWRRDVKTVDDPVLDSRTRSSLARWEQAAAELRATLVAIDEDVVAGGEREDPDER